MSNTQFAFLVKADVPTRQALQASIARLAFDLTLPPELDLIKDSGFVPCVLNGLHDVGFELASGTPEDVFGGRFAAVREADYCISFVWNGSLMDCAAAMIAACALATDYRAVVSYEGEPSEPALKLLEAARVVLAEAMGEQTGE